MTNLISDSYEHVPVDQLEHHPDNPRKGDVESVVASIEANGFFGALVVQRSTRYVLAGNHRLKAARQLGLTEVPVLWADVDDDRARRILLADNRTNDLATYDDRALADVLQELAETDDGLDGTGFDGDALDELIAGLADDDPPPTTDDGDAVPDVFGVAVACESEDRREELMARLEEWGWSPSKIDGNWLAKKQRDPEA